MPADGRPDYEQVMAVGRELDLDDCLYGESEQGPVLRPHRYYYFLAGLVRSRGYRRIVEIGTHYGGSTLAMSRGIADEHRGDARIVTIDITRFNDEALSADPTIVRIQGDSLEPAVVERACAEFDGLIDLLYVDSFHQRRETMQNIAVFANRLQPSTIVVDDILLNPAMRALWTEVGSVTGAAAFDVSELVARQSAGFGVIECRGPGRVRWPEITGIRLTAWRRWRRVHAFLGRVVPERVQQLARPAVLRASDFVSSR